MGIYCPLWRIKTAITHVAITVSENIRVLFESIKESVIVIELD